MSRLGRRVRGLAAVLGAGAVLLGGCASAAGTGPGDAAGAPAPSGLAAGDERLVEPGHGTLRQDAFSVTLRTGAVQVKVTPLAEWMLRLAAPDTWRRLSDLAGRERATLPGLRGPGGREPALFLVSFFSSEPDTPFLPDDLQLVDRGRRFRPVRIRPLTAGWGTQRLEQQQTQTAVYAFPPEVELGLGLVMEYRDARSAEWDRVLRRLEAELSRVRGRTGAPGTWPRGG